MGGRATTPARDPTKGRGVIWLEIAAIAAIAVVLAGLGFWVLDLLDFWRDNR